MAVVFIVFGIIVIIMGLLVGIFVDDGGLVAIFLGILGSCFLSVGIIVYQESSKPTAMDVYQGKTTLEITYKDGVPVDSVVVFKNKEK